jgi:hypothetical protein
MAHGAYGRAKEFRVTASNFFLALAVMGLFVALILVFEIHRVKQDRKSAGLRAANKGER